MTRYSNARLAAWLSLVALLASVNYASRYLVSSSSSTDDALYRYSTAVGATFEYAILFLLIYAIARVDLARLFALRRPTRWLNAAGLGFAAIVAIFLIEAAVAALPLESPGKEQGLTPSHFTSSHALPFAVNAVPIVVFAPIVEELMFRGVGFGLLERYGRPAAIVIVGIAFGVSHGVVVGLLILAPFGAVLAHLRARTESVYPGMIVHALFNGIALLYVLTT